MPVYAFIKLQIIMRLNNQSLCTHKMLIILCPGEFITQSLLKESYKLPLEKKVGKVLSKSQAGFS